MVPDGDRTAYAVDALFDAAAESVSVTPLAPGLGPDGILALQQYAREEVRRRAESLVTSLPAEDDAAASRKYQDDVSSALTFRLEAGAVIEKSYDLDADLSGELAALDWKSVLTVVDLNPPILQLAVRVDADFAGLPIDAVKVTVVHHGQRDSSAEFLFRDAVTPHTFRCWLDPGDGRACDWTARIYYKDSPVTFDLHGTASVAALVIDLGDAGLVDVGVELGLIDFDKLRAAQLTLACRSKALGADLQTTLVLDHDHLSSRWVQPIGESWDGSYRYQVSWLKNDGARLDRPWLTASGRRLILDSPFAGELAIQLTAEGDFAGSDGIARVVASLHYSDAANGYEQDQQVTLDTAEPRTVTFDLLDAQRRDYQYQYVILHKTGAATMVPYGGGWVAERDPRLTIREENDIRLTIDPSALALGDDLKLVQVDLSCDPAPGLHVARSVIFTDTQKTPVTWTVSSGAPAGPRTYSVEVTYCKGTGPIKAAPVLVSDTVYRVPAT